MAGVNKRRVPAAHEEGGGLLAMKVAGLILFTLILFLVPLVWTVDSVLRERLMRQALDNLQEQDQQWQERLRHDLRAAERSIQSFARLLSTQFRPPQAEDEARFHALVQRDADGLWRSRREGFQARVQAGIWAPDQAVARPEDRSFFLQAKQLMEIYGQGAAEHLFANTWVLPAENGEVVFWPGEPEFIYQAPPDQDYRPTEWYQLVSPTNLPEGGVRWTSTSFDPVPKVWMISVVAPFQREGRWGGSAGHDLVINELFQRLDIGSRRLGSEVFLLDHDQRLLIASGHQLEIEEAEGELRAEDLSDRRKAALLQQVAERVGPPPDREPVLLDTGTFLVTALPLDRPDWIIVDILPRQAARALVEGPLRWGLAVSMATLLAACGLVISRDTLRRVRAERDLRATLLELQNFESFVNRSPAVVFLWRAEPGWPVEFVTENVNQFGYEAPDLISGKVVWINTLHAEDLPGLEAEVEKNLEQGRYEFTLQFRLHTPEGETRWVENRTLLLTDARGRLQQVQGIMLDITERQRMQAELQAEQQRYQTLFHHSGAAILYIDRAGLLQMVNEMACRHLEREAAYLQGRPLEEVLPLTLAGPTRERLEEGLRQPATRTYEDEVDLPGGTRWFISTYTTIQDHLGQALGVQVVATDITERKQAELALRESQERYSRLFSAIGDAIFVHEMDEQGSMGRFVEVNQEACRRLGYTREELLALSPHELDAPESHLDPGVFTQLHQHGRALFEQVHMAKDGTRIPVDIRCTRFELNGRPAVISLVRDMRERKAAEAALAESQKRYQLIVETAQEGVWVIDAQSRTTFVNQRMADMLGYAVPDMMGRPLFDFMDEEGVRLAKGNVEKRKRGISESHDFRFKHKDGSDRWAIVSTNPLADAQGRYQGSLALVTDITERRQQEQERRKLEARVQQAHKLESLGIMAAGIAHDFNNLLQAILGHAELALQDAPAGSPQKESLLEIQKAAQRAGQISSQMAAYVGQGSFHRSLLRLETLLHELQPQLKERVARRAVLTVTWDRELPPVLADAAELKHTLVQLVNNALEALGPQDGRITLRAQYRPWRRQELQELFGAPEIPEGPYLSLSITDNGLGMDRATMGHLFEPFFTTKFPGRGLGLMNVLGFVRGHGGGIKVESMPGHGTTVTLVLPEASTPPAAGTVTMPWGWRGSGTLLMVDDEAAVLAAGRRLLTELGFTVLTAGDGREALDVYREQAGQVRGVILDLVMPGLDGAQTLAELRALNPTLPVIIASAYPEEKVTTLLAGLSYQGLIHKPYQTAALARLLQSLLG